MKMNITPELIESAKKAKSIEELLTLAKENGFELSEEEAKAYYEQFHKTGEMSDDELNNVAGGGCYTKDGRLVVTAFHFCNAWKCSACGKSWERKYRYESSYGSELVCPDCGKTANCGSCKYCSYEKGLWLCNRKTK